MYIFKLKNTETINKISNYVIINLRVFTGPQPVLIFWKPQYRRTQDKR